MFTTKIILLFLSLVHGIRFQICCISIAIYLYTSAFAQICKRRQNRQKEKKI